MKKWIFEGKNSIFAVSHPEGGNKIIDESVEAMVGIIKGTAVVVNYDDPSEKQYFRDFVKTIK